MQNKQNKNKYSIYYYCPNGDHEYEDEDEITHLIRNGEEIASGKNVFSSINGNYQYEDVNGVLHRFDKNHKEIK